MLKRCRLCQNPLYSETPEGITIREENHNEVFIEGVTKITCSCGYEHYLKEESC